MIHESAALGTSGAREAAGRATAQGFLNCYLRETGDWRVEETPDGNTIVCPLPHQGIEISAPVRYLSPTGRHLFDFPLRYRIGGGEALDLDYATLVALAVKELSLRYGDGGDGRGDELLLRVIESCHNVERFYEARRDDADRLGASESAFIEAEQSLIFGHHLHPVPKSRQDFSEIELPEYSPELEASFPLHYFRAHASVLADGSALGESATSLVKRELREDPAVGEEFVRGYCGEDGYALIPAHPWQAEFLMRKPEVRRLIERGLLEHLGPVGSPYSPTASIRTVYRREAAFMLKLSLNVRITNSVRGNLPKELERGVEVHRIMEGGIGRELRERFPGFDIIRDPAYLTVDTGEAQSGFEVVLRRNPYRGDHQPDAAPVIALCQDHVSGEGSRLSRIVKRLAQKEERPTEEVARDWFRRYLDISLRPILWLYLRRGIAVEPHQQNSVVELSGGYPARFRYRDNQGYYYRESAREELERSVPGIGERSETFCEEAVSDERLRYYFFINNLFGVVNALGCGGVADERVLLAEIRRELERASEWSPPGSDLIPSLLDREKLPGKANLLTRFHDMDELVGDLATQSVYAEIENPLARLAKEPR